MIRRSQIRIRHTGCRGGSWIFFGGWGRRWFHRSPPPLLPHRSCYLLLIYSYLLSLTGRIQKTVCQRKLKLHLDQNSRHIYICEFHKSMIQTVRVKRKRFGRTLNELMEGRLVDLCCRSQTLVPTLTFDYKPLLLGMSLFTKIV